jgi:hypothetical protein
MEKAREIKVKADEDFNIEKVNLLSILIFRVPLNDIPTGQDRSCGNTCDRRRVHKEA